MASVFVLWHMGHEWDAVTGEGDEDAKMLGVFSTRARAESWQDGAKSLPGFRDRPDNFIIDECVLDERQWTTGYWRAE